jgi:hypothetical protein
MKNYMKKVQKTPDGSEYMHEIYNIGIFKGF